MSHGGWEKVCGFNEGLGVVSWLTGCGLTTDGQTNRDATTRVRNGNEDAVVAQNEQGTEHCRPVASGLLVAVGRSWSWPGKRDGEGWSSCKASASTVLTILQGYDSAHTINTLLQYLWKKFYDIA